MRSTMSYEDTMAWGAAQYADVLTALNETGLPAIFTQTGGMCAAIEVQLETGRTLLITDFEDSLSWSRTEHTGWSVGLYDVGEDRDGPLVFDQLDGGDITSLLNVIRRVLLMSNRPH